MRNWLTFLSLQTLMADSLVAQIVDQGFKGVVAEDETADGREDDLTKHFYLPLSAKPGVRLTFYL